MGLLYKCNLKVEQQFAQNCLCPLQYLEWFSC